MIQIRRSWDGKTDAEESAAPPVRLYVFVLLCSRLILCCSATASKDLCPSVGKTLAIMLPICPLQGNCCFWGKKDC